ncbi:MAG: quinone oxidoreductase [Bifidobacteriaceae bacterium]|jgi:NADPH2:quinone reductase|nr:quinone oxidoreductase [Bifidobacteriaceae bacterium]
MRAITAVRPGGPEVLEVLETELAAPAAGQVRVKVVAAGVNFIDTYRRAGVYRTSFPHQVGLEGAGVVEAVGADVTGLHVGQRVAWASSESGSYAEVALVGADKTLPVPDELDLEVAAALPLQGMTADYLTHSTYPLGPGDVAVIYAAAGGVGGLAVQMALAAGARVIATVGSAAKIPAVAALGVPEADIVNLGALSDLTVALPREILERTGARGADVVYDGIGRATFHATLASLRPRGTAVLFGGASGQVEPLDPQELNAHGSLYLTRPKLDDYTASRAELFERGARVLGAAGAGKLRVNVGQRFALDQAAAAHRAIESGTTQGKILLLP